MLVGHRYVDQARQPRDGSVKVVVRNDGWVQQRPRALAATALGFVMLAIYLTTVVAEGNNSLFDVLPWAVLMAIPPITAFWSTRTEDPRTARTILIGAASFSAAIGFVSILSIGIGFIMAAGMAAWATGELPPGRRSGAERGRQATAVEGPTA